MSDTRTLDEVIKPALDAYGAELMRHTRKSILPMWDAAERGEMTVDEVLAIRPSCECGFTPGPHIPKRNVHRSLGLHIAAAMRRASKACDVESARLMDEARRNGWH